jgi:hypothetical protein
MHALLFAIALAVAPVDDGQLQSLGDAAKKAEETRKASDDARSFTARDLIDLDWIITRQGYEAYANARAEIALIRRRSTVLHQKLFNASRNVPSLADLAPVMSAEPAVVQALGRYGLNSREYLRREQAIVNANAWAQRRLPESIKSRPIPMQNVEFVRANERFMRDTAAKYLKAEASPPWFNPARFVEEP